MTTFRHLFIWAGALSLCMASAALAQSTSATIPSNYQSLYDYLASQIDTFQTTINSNWNGSKSPVVYSAELLTVNSNNGLALLGPNVPSKYRQELQRLKSSGVQAVTFNIAFPLFYQPFYDSISNPGDYQPMVKFYTQVAADAHAAGLKVIVETSLLFSGYYSKNAGFDVSVYYPTLSLTQLTNARAQNAITILQQVKPDYLNLGSEPDTQAGIANQPTINTASGYTTYVGSMISQINSAGVHGSVKIGAGVGTWLQNAPDFVNGLLTTPIDYLDLHVYPVNRTFFANAATLADMFLSAGRPVAMSEAWLLKESDSELATGDVASDPKIYARDAFSFWAPLDQKFLTACVDLANWKQFVYFSAFWSRYFWAYLDYNQYQADSSDQVTNAAEQAALTAITSPAAFTSTYTAYQSLVSPTSGTGLTTVSAASFGTGSQAPDSIISLFGTGLASGTMVAQNLLSLPTALGGTSVTIQDSANNTSNMGLYFVSTGQINAVIPPSLPSGPATITVLSGSTTLAQSTVTLAAVAPAFFTANQNGKGAPAALIVKNLAAGGQTRDVAFQCTGGAGTCAPKPISLGGAGDSVAIELYGTGIRGRSSIINVTATVGTTGVPVLYAGAQSQYAGFDQVDLLLPRSLAGAGTVDLTLTADGVGSNVVTINIQ